jgi:hypothetical protein
MIRGPMMHVLSKHTVSVPVTNRRVPGTAQATESSHIVTGHHDFRPNGQEVIHMFRAVQVSGRAKKEDGEQEGGSTREDGEGRKEDEVDWGSLANAEMGYSLAAAGRLGFVVPGPETDCRKPLWLPYSWLFPNLPQRIARRGNRH